MTASQALLPAAVYGLEVPPGDVTVPAHATIRSMLRITMAAIDPTADPEGDSAGPQRATLKLVRRPLSAFGDSDDEEDDDDLDAEDMSRLLDGDADDLDTGSSEEGSDEEANGGPSDPSKSRKIKREEAVKAIEEALQDVEPVQNGDTMELDGPSKKGKGKAKATLSNGLEDDEESDEDYAESLDAEIFVVCTLDPVQHCQQALDIVINDDEQVFFEVSGTHTVYLTGNYLMGPEDSDYDPEDEEVDFNFNDQIPLRDSDEELDDEESDELDDMDDPRITELATDEDEAETPKLVKGKKRPASDSSEDIGEPVGLDEIIAKSIKPETPAVKTEVPATNGEQKLSKKQRKKLKNQQGKAAAAPETPAPAGNNKADPTDSGSSGSKKVQFADKLEQGPTPKKVEIKAEVKTEEVKPENKTPQGSAKPNVKTVKGVTIDDRKIGTGKKAKKGSRLDLRYIGKLTDGKEFDANKKGKPFTVKVGAGEVIDGWDLGLEGIAAGGERKLTVPAHMAYGNKKMPGIPPNSQLVFDIKCLSVQ